MVIPIDLMRKALKKENIKPRRKLNMGLFSKLFGKETNDVVANTVTHRLMSQRRYIQQK